MKIAMVIMVVILMVVGGGIWYPTEVNSMYLKKYGRKCWSIFGSIIQGMSCSFFLLQRRHPEHMFFWILLFMTIFSYLVFSIFAWIRAKELGATMGERILAVTAQLLAPAAFVIELVVMVITMSRHIQSKK